MVTTEVLPESCETTVKRANFEPVPAELLSHLQGEANVECLTDEVNKPGRSGIALWESIGRKSSECPAYRLWVCRLSGDAIGIDGWPESIH